jgi:hypothetical protein
MPTCASCHVVPAPELIQIQRRYRAEWNGLELSVELGSSQWTLNVRDEAHTLYTAYRGNQTAAQVSAAEFAITHALGFTSSIRPTLLAHQLAWQ